MLPGTSWSLGASSLLVGALRLWGRASRHPMAGEIRMTPSTPTARWTLAAGAIAVVVACSVPLWMGLGAADLQNDEAIYSYAVDRMLDTGDWITPRAIPFDNAFLEKPPL